MWLSILLAAGGVAIAAPPPWARHDTFEVRGSIYSAVCSGLGPSIGLARQDAIDSCTVSAARHLSRELSVRSLSIASEREVAFHQEVVQRDDVTGLVCVPRREEIQEFDSGAKVWLKCEFDLSRARRTGKPRVSAERPGPGVADARKVLTLAVIPRCSELLVRGGAAPRIVPCAHDPVSVLVEPSDREVLVRADGYLPRSISVDPSWGGRSYGQIILVPSL